jgi:WD40 repeat protein
MLSITDGTSDAKAKGDNGFAQKLVPPKRKAEDSAVQPLLPNSVRSLLPSKANLLVKPTWHAPWKLYRVISGHTGWVRTVDVEPNNEWFATGGADRIIKVRLKLFAFLFIAFRFGIWLLANCDFR